MALKISVDEADELLYAARTGEKEEFDVLTADICKREGVSVVELLQVVKYEHNGNGILHMAAANGHHALIAEICKALCASSPQNPTMLSILNAQNDAGNTALHWAALCGHLECVKILLDQGSDPTITNQSGHDAVYEAELNDKQNVVEWVLKEGGEGLEEGISGDVGEAEAEADGENVKMEDAEEDEESKHIAEGLSRMGFEEKGES